MPDWILYSCFTIVAMIVAGGVGLLVALIFMDLADWPYIFVWLLPACAFAACILLLPWGI